MNTCVKHCSSKRRDSHRKQHAWPQGKHFVDGFDTFYIMWQWNESRQCHVCITGIFHISPCQKRTEDVHNLHKTSFFVVGFCGCAVAFSVVWFSCLFWQVIHGPLEEQMPKDFLNVFCGRLCGVMETIHGQHRNSRYDIQKAFHCNEPGIKKHFIEMNLVFIGSSTMWQRKTYIFARESISTPSFFSEVPGFPFCHISDEMFPQVS